jgi:Tfp pilus assembly protein PilN
MKNLDFLPDSYRKREALRRARLWWAALVVIFGTAIGSAASAQYLMRLSVERELREIAPQFAESQIRVQELTALQAQVAAAGRSARLVTWLEHPWPTSQIMAEVVRPLPETIRLTEIHVVEETQERQAQPAAGPRRRGAKSEDEEGPKLSPAEADFAQLQAEAENRQTVIRVNGVTRDVAAVHAYVGAVGQSPLFASAEIKSLETLPDENQTNRTTFLLRITVKPGHGQPGDGVPAPGKPAAVTLRSHAATSQVARGGEQP